VLVACIVPRSKRDERSRSGNGTTLEFCVVHDGAGGIHELKIHDVLPGQICVAGLTVL